MSRGISGRQRQQWSLLAGACWWGHGSDHQCPQNETHEHREISTRLFCRRARVLKKLAKKKRPSLFICNTGDAPVPFPWIRPGCLFCLVGYFETNCYWEERERGEGVVGGRFSQNWSKMGSPRFPLIEKTLCYFPRCPGTGCSKC